MDIDALQFGYDTFGDVTRGPDGAPKTHAQVIRDVVEEAVLADEVGLHTVGIGEHHRDDYAISAPDVVLAGIATRTGNIRLSSAVTVLSSDDPVRVHERFATVDALSNGRAEIIVGRGSFTESFPLFGYDLADYEELFEEKLALFARLRGGGEISTTGKHTQDLRGVTLHPPLEGDRQLPTWVAVGGSPNSVIRAAHHGLPLFLAIIGGNAHRFAPFADLYRRALTEFDKPRLPVAFHSPGHIAATDEQAREEFYGPYRQNMDRLGRERGWSPVDESHFRDELEHGALLVGSPQTVARKLAAAISVLEAQRFHLKQSMGDLPHAAIMNSLELYGTEVVPLVKDILASEA